MTTTIRGPRRVVRRPVVEAPPIRHRARLLVFLGAMLVAFALIVSRLTSLQLTDSDRYRELGESQRTFSQSIAAERGTIYDRNGVELAMSTPAKSVFVDPALIDPADVSRQAAQVAPILGLDEADVERAMRSDGRFVYLVRKVPTEVADKVAALGLPGVALVDESERHHPSGDLARSIIGSVDVDNNGIAGLEQQFSQELTGTPGQVVFERNPDGRTIPVGDHQMIPAVKGSDLVLTLDRSMQYETERILTEQVRETDSKGGTAIVSRPETGEILAIANVVHDREKGTVTTGSNNAALTSVYEPGSVMKMVTVASAIEHGVVAPDTVIDVPSSLQIADATFSDAEEHGGLSWTVTQIVAHSSNIGTIKIAQQVGKDRLYDALKSFGFGDKTALEFPYEQGGLIPNPSDPNQWWATSMGSVPIGQSVAVTPLQMLLAYNTIANGGVYVAPRLVKSTIDPDGNEHPYLIDEGRRVVSKDTADKLNVMLRDVVAEGTGKKAAVSGYTPAGKTGTSRKPAPTGGYVWDDGSVRYQSTFVGFVPAEQPALSVIVIMDEPRANGYTGGVVSAPAFAKIASFGLQHFAIGPPLTDGATGAVAEASATERSDGAVQPNGKIRGLTAETAPESPVSPEQGTTPTTEADDTTEPTTKRTTTRAP